MEKFASGLDEASREKEKQKIKVEEMNITEFTVEPEMEKVMTDFYTKPYSDPLKPLNEAEQVIPLNYYDNDDGFWDEYIQEKYSKWGDNLMITNRLFIRH